MRIAARYSHLNGEEYMLVHRRSLWNEIQEVIEEVDATACKTKVSKGRAGKAAVFSRRHEQRVQTRT